VAIMHFGLIAILHRESAILQYLTLRVRYSIMANVMWSLFDQSIEQLAVGHTTIHNVVGSLQKTVTMHYKFTKYIIASVMRKFHA